MRSFLLLLPLTLCAADLQVRDLRLEVGHGDLADYEAEYRYTAGPASELPSGTYTSDEYDGGSIFSIAALYTRADLAPFGFLWAAGIEYQTSSDDIDGETFTTDLVGGKVRLGMGWTPAPLWRFEATAEGGLGYMQVDDADVVSGSGVLEKATADGHYAAIGLQIGGGYAIKGKWEVGLSARLMHYEAETEAEFDGIGSSYEADLSWLLWSVAVTGGYRF
jgi:hypothetical protein